MQTIRLIIADDHPILRQGIHALLQEANSIEVIGEASTGREALFLVDKLRPDILLMDVEMPDLSGIEVAEQLHQKGASVRVLVLSAYDDVEYVQRILNCGIAGYLLKDEAATIIVQAVEDVARGATGWFSRQINSQINRMMQRDSLNRTLTERELDVLRLAAQGKTNNAIARVLCISEKTVEKHLDSIYRKLDVRSRTEAAVVAVQEALI